MTLTVAIIAPGAMGAAVGRRLAEHGARVLTALGGRSEASAARARASGMVATTNAALVAEAAVVLSIVPPGAAVALAERLLPFSREASHRPLFVDCNAIAPATARQIGRLLEQTPCRFVDGAIIGGPPKPGEPGPRFYLSGPHADEARALAALGLDLRIMAAPLGAASALKMSYAALTKGLTALCAAAVLGAGRSSVDPALLAELEESQKPLLAWIRRQVPAMYPKAYRWVAEMEEIAAFMGEDEAAGQIYQGAAKLYARLADSAGAAEIAALEAFIAAAKRDEA
jgi:3-hydroxyisobutyrate dehydrogenase-like beta-hydroxyacid dehydrogenase